MPSTPEAIIQHPGDAQVLHTKTSTVRLLIDSDDTQSAMTGLEITLTPGGDGATPHYHTLSDEMFHVVEGDLQLLAGDRIVTVGAGGSILVPKLVRHAFGAAPGSAARFLVDFAPGIPRFDYFRLLEQLATGQASMADLLAVQDRFDNYFVEAPEWWREREANRLPLQ